MRSLSLAAERADEAGQGVVTRAVASADAAPGPPTPAVPVRVLYVGGVGRSGSTVLGRALTRFDGVTSVGEIVHLWTRGLGGNERCGCGEPFRDCPFWHGVGRAAFGGWDRVDAQAMEELRLRVDRTRFLPMLATGHAPAGFHQALADYADVVVRLYRGIAEQSGAQLVVDSSKHPSFAWLLAQVPQVDLRLLHLVRDSRGVAYSWLKKVARPEVADRVEYMQGEPAYVLARHWLFTNTCFDAAAAAGTSVLRVRYEDFVDDTVATMRRIASFAGLPMGAAELAPFAAASMEVPVQHEVSGNPMRFGGNTIHLRRDDEWRTRMAPGARRAVTAMTGVVLKRYGY